MANQPSQDTDLILRNGSLKGANYHPDKAEFPNRKETDQVSRPSKKLLLYLKGHTQGVNCIRWNVTESNNQVLSFGYDKTARLFDVETGIWCINKSCELMYNFALHCENIKQETGDKVSEA